MKFRTGDTLLMSVAECAKHLGCSDHSVYALVDSGEWIGARRAGTKPVISRAAFERLYLDGVWHSDEAPARTPFLRRIEPVAS